ncbi:DUF362 domain-containing protein [Candidatus Magnetobacterium casense]|uniref:DUF362 domain-containing protein n=1 Tax=Candidatus Magnetobacterium casense TaxID=1455061 RepID=A0ABS6RUX0_9BACT|nr:DUF362 domain-containing protein [Candidatus Magnetobacterium casensis]MBV6340425.1 DUF362 domain-containing protein [Candidatus Magnetobacterium casensis]
MKKTAKVYFATARSTKWRYSDSMPGKLQRLMAEVGLSAYFNRDEWVAVKTHFGSPGAHRIVRPTFLRTVVDALRGVGAKPFVTDTVRIQGLDYLEVANANGINHLSVGAPVILADGLYGKDSILVKAGSILKEIAVASVIHDVTAMVVCSHVKGHINAGYAGAIKNLAMGGVSSSHRHCGWKCGRGSMHTIGEGMMRWEQDLCQLCMQCVEVCPLEVITFVEEKMVWNGDKCWRCGRCQRVCPASAIDFPGDDERFMRSMAEAAGVVLGTFAPSKVLYINFLTEIQPECDCMPTADVPMVQDIGILVSDDVVAIEQASIDLVLKERPLPSSAADGLTGDVFKAMHAKPYEFQLDEAQHLGLGTSSYELITLT